MTANKLNIFTKTILKGQTCPADLQQWLTNEVCCNEILYDEMEARLLDAATLPPLLTHSYLNDNDRKNPEVMANIKAIDEVFSYITFAVEAQVDNLLGYWHGPERLPIEISPIIQYDNEGLFHLMAGKTIIETLMADHFYYEPDNLDDFLEMKKQFKACNLTVKLASHMKLEKFPTKTNPSTLHDKLYKKYNRP